MGNFKNPGTKLKHFADLVNDHDFCSYAIGKAFPYGLFDDVRLEGFVYLGQSLWDGQRKKFDSSETPDSLLKISLGGGKIMGGKGIQQIIRFSYWQMREEVMDTVHVCGK